MLKAVTAILCCLIINQAVAQVFPGEGDVVNYRLVGFTVPHDVKAEKYLFEVSENKVSDKGETLIENTIRQVSDSHRIIILLPHFDMGYVWRVSYLNEKGKIISKTADYHFRTGKYPSVDSNRYRMKIIDSATHHDELYVILDFLSVIYDLKGNPVWYLPDIHLVAERDLQMRDIKPTKDHTFTASSNFNAFEFDYNGKTLWTAPNDGRLNNDTIEYYHHEFTKLDNGNYMGATLEHRMMKVPPWITITEKQKTTGFVEKRADGHYYRRVTLGNLVEYTKDRELVWYWKSIDHFNDTDFFRTKIIHGINTDMHLNAFDFDEKNKVIYMSFRNMNEVVKIDYPSGKILKRYGAIWINDSTKDSKRMFYGQHCVRKEDDGRLYMFNNNSNPSSTKQIEERKKPTSLVSVFEETGTKTGLKNVWEFPCNMDTFAETYSGVGGSVAMLDDKCLLVSMGSTGRIFIVSPGKEKVWNVIAQVSENGTDWYPMAQYRANFITRKELEKFIFK